MSIDDLQQFVDEQSIRGDIAREFTGILSDYNAGHISLQDKNALVTEALSALEAQGLAQDEVMFRWAVNVTSLVLKVA